MGVPALVPFRDRSAGTHCCHSAFPGAESSIRRGAGLHCHVCRPRDRHHSRRIRARCATTRRGDMVTCGRLDKLAKADGVSRTELTQRSVFRALPPAAAKQASNGRYRATWWTFRPAGFGRPLPVRATQCAGQIRANDWSSRMHMSGQVECKWLIRWSAITQPKGDLQRSLVS